MNMPEANEPCDRSAAAILAFMKTQLSGMHLRQVRAAQVGIAEVGVVDASTT